MPSKKLRVALQWILVLGGIVLVPVGLFLALKYFFPPDNQPALGILAVMAATPASIGALRVWQRRQRLEDSVAGEEGDPRQLLDLVGKWKCEYLWRDERKFGFRKIKKGFDILEFQNDPKEENRITGTATDDDGQNSAVSGEVFGNMVVWHYVSQVPNRPSCGSALVEWDCDDSSKMKGYCTYHDVWRKKLVASPLRLTKIS